MPRFLPFLTPFVTWLKRAPVRVLEWLRRNYLWLAIPVGGLAYVLIALFITWELPGLADQGLTRLAAIMAQGDATEIRNIAYAVGALLGALAILATIPFQLIKTWMNERAALTAEAGQITDRINKAVEQLGAEKTVTYEARRVAFETQFKDKIVHHGFTQRWDEVSDISHRLPEEIRNLPIDEKTKRLEMGKWQTVSETVPNLEVRLGGIYALERIAQDSLRDHIQVMEILTAYIRHNAPAEGQPMRDYDEDLDYFLEWLEGPRIDIQAAITVIGRREDRQIEVERKKDYRLDLRDCCLRMADMSGENFNLERARLKNSLLERANLSRARMERADLISARMERADLSWARMGRVNLSGASMKRADLSKAQHLTQDAVKSASGDETTNLPKGLEHPKHWK